MATPSEADVQDQLKRTVEILDDLSNAIASASPNFKTNYDGLVDVLESDYAQDHLAAVDSLRGVLSSIMTPQRAQQMLLPVLRAYALHVMNVPERDGLPIMGRLYDWFIANSLAVKSRVFTFGTPSYTGTGDGVLNRLTKDRSNLDIENQTADAKVATCVADERSGAVRHEELFEIRGASGPRDWIALAGSGKVGSINAVSARNSLVRNASFSSIGGSPGALTSLTDWTPNSSISNFDVSTSVYRDFDGDSVPYSLKIVGNDKVVQKFRTTRLKLDPATPYYCQIAWNREIGSGDGTITLKFGNKTASVAVGTTTGWNILRMAIGTNNWYPNFNEDNAGIEIQLSGWSTGYILVDDVILAPYTPFDGGWYALVGGATQFLRGGKFNWTDSEVGAINQKWFWRSFGVYLPHATGGSITLADPT